MIRRLALAVCVLALAVAPAQAGKFNKKLNIGDAAPTFANLPGTDGKMYSLADMKEDIVVVCITCNKCPMAVAYEDRMIAFVKKYEGKVGFVAINVNHAEADGPEKMKERAKEKGFNFPYAYDESQEIAKQLGARVTPEFFVFNKERKVVYMGALDDNADPAKATRNYLVEAVEATMAGKTPEVTETAARGCGVNYIRK